MRRIQAVLALLAGVFLASAAGAATSQYSSIDTNDCVFMVEDEITSAAWFTCPAFGEHTVTVMEGDLRFFLIIDDQDREKMLSGQTLAPFNRLGKMLEWRLGTDGKAFATIVRYLTQCDGGDGRFSDGQVLVVSKIGAEACHVAYVDARANADANALARAAADKHAASFNCATDAVLRVGKPGRSLGE
ncbi:MAG: hypothetical protein Q7V31_11850 [Parvibaculum sp.]|uniref:hypothetical protein n=1 Tax=Parvibaculum sp. TaxID=2024848 RepID=UPI002715D128|nr:hypothetical protein [Parvibaculum sp.]MDO8839612.1 hypothetical protein [Parvibaculum sp.]